MDAKKLIELRKQAEKAVAEMPDGDMKLKAFEVILAHLLGGSAEASAPPAQADKGATGKTEEKKQAKTAVGRILVLRDEAFFKKLRSIAEVKEELSAHGWHYPSSSLSGPLQSAAQQGKLRRQRVKQGNKRIWKYSNP